MTQVNTGMAKSHAREVPDELDSLRAVVSESLDLATRLSERLEPVLNHRFIDPLSEPVVPNDPEPLCDLANEINEATDTISQTSRVLAAIVDHLEI